MSALSASLSSVLDESERSLHSDETLSSIRFGLPEPFWYSPLDDELRNSSRKGGAELGTPLVRAFVDSSLKTRFDPTGES